MKIFGCFKFLGEIGKEKEGWNFDFENDVLKGSVVTHNGEVRWPPKEPIGPPKTPAPSPDDKKKVRIDFCRASEHDVVVVFG